MPGGRADAQALAAHHATGFLSRFVSEHPGMGAQKVAVALRSFLRFLRYEGDVAADLAASIPLVASWQKTALPKLLPPGAVKKVLQQCDRKSAVGRRDYAILLLLARLGLRGAEVASLQLEDIDWANSQITVRSNKRHGWVRLPLPLDVGGAIARYLRHDRPACSGRHVFVRMVAPFVGLGRVAVIAGITRRAIQRASIESFRKGAHVFRHTLATDMLRRGATLREIGQVLGHRRADTTAIYAKVDLAILRPLALRWPGGGQ